MTDTAIQETPIQVACNLLEMMAEDARRQADNAAQELGYAVMKKALKPKALCRMITEVHEANAVAGAIEDCYKTAQHVSDVR